MSRQGDKRRNHKQRDARRQAQKLDVHPETVDPVKTLLAPFADDIEKIKLGMLKTGYAVEFLLVRDEARRELLLWDQDIQIVSLMRRINGLPFELQVPRFPDQGSSRRDHPWNVPATDLFPPNFIKHLLDAGYDFGVHIIVAGLTYAESNKLTALNHEKYGPPAHINPDGPQNGTIIFVARKV
jgi:hypothetical protein